MTKTFTSSDTQTSDILKPRQQTLQTILAVASACHIETLTNGQLWQFVVGSCLSQ